MIGCVLAIPVFYLTAVHSRYPVTLDILITIALTELNRFVVEGRRMALRWRQRYYERPPLQEKLEWDPLDLESQRHAPRLECVAAVVGWREDPSLYARALDSYKSASTCVFLLAGIDGDEEEDQEMVKTFSRVSTYLIYLPTPETQGPRCFGTEQKLT